MQRYVTGLAFVLGFVGVMALAAGGTWPAVSGSNPGSVDAPNTRVLLPGNPSHTSFGSLGSDGNFHGVVPPDSDLTPTVITPAGSASHMPFGTLMPDGTYCGVDCPSWESNP